MIKISTVKLWGNTVGVVSWNDGGYGNFEFEPTFLDRGLDVSPVLLSINDFPKGTIFNFPGLNPNTYKGLPGLLADSLPDKFGNEIINEYLSRQGRDINSVNPVERLCFVGSRGMGALEFEPAQKTGNNNNKSESLEVNALIKAVKEILSKSKSLGANLGKDNPDDVMHTLLQIGSSAGGARAKAIIAYNPLTNDVRSGRVDGLSGYKYCILKFDGVQETALTDTMDYGRVEYAYYLMATEAGINMMPCWILEQGNKAHFVTERFDRVDNQKIHMQSLCSLEHYDYNNPLAYSYEQAMTTIRKISVNAYEDGEQLFRRMVFNVVGANHDDHTKNISFLMNKSGEWRLSPAYDLTYAYNQDNQWLKQHNLSVNGKRNEIAYNDLIIFSKAHNIKKAKTIIDQVISAINKWHQFAATAEVPKIKIKIIKNSLEKFALKQTKH